MKLLINLTLSQTKKLLESRKMFDVCVLPMAVNLKEIISDYMYNNTGYETKSVIGVSKVFGNDGLSEVWDDLNSFIPMSSGDFVLEFEMPNDACATMSYRDFLAFNSAKDLLPEEVTNKLMLEGHVEDENEVVFCPFIDIKYCTSFIKVGDDFEQSKEDIKSFNELVKATSFL